MRSSFFRRRSPLPLGGEYQLPDGKVATPAQLAEFRRRKRRFNLYFLLILFGFAPGAVWIALAFVHGPLLLFSAFIGGALILGLLLALTENSFRCPVCERTFLPGSRMR